MTTETSNETPPVVSSETPPVVSSETPPVTSTHTPPVTPPQTRTESNPNWQELRDAIDSIPEKIANALREAKPDTSTTQQKTEAPPAETKAPGKKTFAEMWFG